MRGTAFLQSLPAGGDPRAVQAREEAVLDAVRRGQTLPIVWAPIEARANGHTGTIWVAADTLRFGVPGPNADPSDWDWVRLAVTAEAAQRIADELGVLMPTDKILDLAYAQANVRLTPHFQDPVTATTGAMLEHHRQIEAERAGREGLLSPVGKDWILGNELYAPRPGAPPPHPLGVDGAVNYGWHVPATTENLAAIAFHRSHPQEPYKGPYMGQPGVILWQTRGCRHNLRHVDYSQWVPRFVHPWMKVDGQRVRTADVMMSPALSGLLTYDVPLRGTRYPIPNKPQNVPSSGASGGAAAGLAHPSPDTSDPFVANEAASSARAVNAFGLDLYRRFRGAAGNLALSPASLATALTMVLGGARGETAAQIERVLHLHAGMRPAHELVGALAGGVHHAGPGVTLRSANRLFAERSCAIVPGFVDWTRNAFGAPLEPVDFRHGSDDARHRINGWVAQRTQGRVRDLIPPGGADADTRLVLANAIYFLGEWAAPFEPQSTCRRPFFGSDGSSDVPMMHRTGEYLFAALDGLKALELRYRGDDLAMVILLPDAPEGLAPLERRLTSETVDTWLGALAAARVAVSLPKFRIEPEGLSLAPALSALGMPLAFDRQKADLTGIANPPSPGERLCLSDVFHKAFVNVDEKGTEAAAATAVVTMKAASLDPKPAAEFNADHPFLFLLRDTRSGLILFLGRVLDPGNEGGQWTPQVDPPGAALLDTSDPFVDAVLTAAGADPWDDEAAGAAEALGGLTAKIAGAAGGDRVGAEAATGAQIGGSIGTALEAVPAVGPLLHAAATVIGAIGGAISGALRDTFSPTALEDLGVITAVQFAPGILFSGINNVTVTNGTNEHPPEEHAARQMRYFLLSAGVIRNTGPLYNAHDFGRSDNPAMEHPDPRFPFTDPRNLTPIKRAVEQGRWAPPAIHTPEQAKAAMALLRKIIVPGNLLGWTQIRTNLPYLRAAVQRVRALAGETGADAQLTQLLGGDVTPRGRRPVARRPGATSPGTTGARLQRTRPAAPLRRSGVHAVLAPLPRHANPLANTPDLFSPSHRALAPDHPRNAGATIMHDPSDPFLEFDTAAVADGASAGSPFEGGAVLALWMPDAQRWKSLVRVRPGLRSGDLARDIAAALVERITRPGEGRHVESAFAQVVVPGQGVHYLVATGSKAAARWFPQGMKPAWPSWAFVLRGPLPPQQAGGYLGDLAAFDDPSVISVWDRSRQVWMQPAETVHAEIEGAVADFLVRAIAASDRAPSMVKFENRDGVHLFACRPGEKPRTAWFWAGTRPRWRDVGVSDDEVSGPAQGAAASQNLTRREPKQSETAGVANEARGGDGLAREAGALGEPGAALAQLLAQIDRRFPFRGKGLLDGITSGVLRITEDRSMNGPLCNGPDLHALKGAVHADSRASRVDVIADRTQTRYLAITVRPSEVTNTSLWNLDVLEQGSPASETGNAPDDMVGGPFLVHLRPFLDADHLRALRPGAQAPVPEEEDAGYPARPSLAALRRLEEQLDAKWPERTKWNGGNVSDASVERGRGVLDVPESPSSLGPRLADLRAAVQRDGRVVETEIVAPSVWASQKLRVPTLRIWTADGGADPRPWDLSVPPTDPGWELYRRRAGTPGAQGQAGRADTGDVSTDAAAGDPFAALQNG